MDLARTSAGEMARAVRAGEIGPVELFELHAARIPELNGELNAIVLPRLEEARAEAEAAERALGSGEPLKPGGTMTLASYANAFGLPSVSVPALRDDDGMPVGVLVTGRRGHDLQVIAAARELERLLGGYLAP